MNKEVNPKIAKLLKDKYQEVTAYSYDNNGKLFYCHGKNEDKISNVYSAPTIAEVVMWLYEKHGIFIQPFPIGEEGKMKFYTKLIVNDNSWVKIKHQISTIYNSPTEAYLAAIEYTLINLIK